MLFILGIIGALMVIGFFSTIVMGIVDGTPWGYNGIDADRQAEIERENYEPY